MEWLACDLFDQGLRGSLKVLDSPPLPFPVKRVFWIEGVGRDQIRGQHKHLVGDEVLFVARGSLEIYLRFENGEEARFTIDKESKALWVNAGIYIEMTRFSPDALLLVLCSHAFKDDPVV